MPIEPPKPPKNPTIVSLDGDDEYQRKIDEARAKRVPLGHVAMPKIRPFDEYREGDTSAEAAGVQGGGRTDPMRLLTPEQIQKLQQMGEFIPGAGSQYAVNQPSAYKVMGENEPKPEPQQQPISISAEGTSEYANPPRPVGAGLSQKTKEELERLAEHTKKESEVEKKGDISDEEFREEADKLTKSLDLDGFNTRVRSLLTHPERKKKIEGRCTPMSLKQLIEHFEVRQTVRIVPGQYEVIFRSVAGEEGLFCKRMLGEELDGSEQYFSDKFTLMMLTCGLYQVNDRLMPSHIDNKREMAKEAFLAKFSVVLKYPEVLLADLSTNFFWFNKRVEKLLVENDIQDF